MTRDAPDLEEYEVLLLWIGQHFAGGLALAAAAVADDFAQQAEVRLVGDEGQHDEVRVQPVQAVPLVRLVIRPLLCPADMLHDLVLALARNVVPCSRRSKLSGSVRKRNEAAATILDFSYAVSKEARPCWRVV